LNLATVTVDEFTPLVGERFTVDVGEAGALELELTAATVSGRGDARDPFALRFRGPAEPLLSQAIYPLSNAATGKLEIFIVPVGANAEGTDYEAIFT
jgi:hypothetical protein